MVAEFSEDVEVTRSIHGQTKGSQSTTVVIRRLGGSVGKIGMRVTGTAVLRRGDRTLEIDFLCDASHAAILAGHPDLAAVHALAVRRRGRDAAARQAAATRGGTRGGTRGTAGTILALHRRRFDLAVDLFFNPRSAWLLRLAGIPRRIGGTRSRSRRHLPESVLVASQLVPSGTAHGAAPRTL